MTFENIGTSSRVVHNPCVLVKRLTEEEIVHWTGKNRYNQSSSLANDPLLIMIKQEPGTSGNIHYCENVVQNTEHSLFKDGANINIKTEPVDPVQIKTERPDTHKYNCSVCGMGFDDWEKTILHKYFKHKNYLPFKCDICDEAFGLNAHLTQHLLNHVDYRRTKKPLDQILCRNNYFKLIPTKVKPFKCTNCIYGTKSLDKFSYHLTVCNVPSENINDNEPNVCRLCFKKFSTESKLKRHIRYHKFMAKLNLQVTNRRPNIDNTPSNQNDLSNNQQTIQPFRIKFANNKNIQQNKLTEIKCTFCKTSYKSDKALSVHVKLHHHNQNTSSKASSVKCQWCGTFITKGNFLRHVKNKHPHVKPLKCPYCPMRFKHFSSQKTHILKCIVKKT